MEYKTKTYHTVDYDDLEKKILEVYGQKYEIPCSEECGNDVSLTFTTNLSDRFDGDDAHRLRRFTETGKGQWLLSLFLQELTVNGHIPEGNWIVKVSW